MKSISRARSGHTVVELLIVALVLALLAGIALPSSTVGDKRKLDTLQLEIQDAIDHAQSLAYHEGSVYGVHFSTSGQWFSVVNDLGAPVDDPLSHGDYLIQLGTPGQPQGVAIDYAMFGGKPLAPFNSKGVLTASGEIRLRSGTTERWLICNTATATLTEIPVGN